MIFTNEIIGWLIECIFSLIGFVLIGYLISLKFKSKRKIIITISVLLALISPTANLYKVQDLNNKVEASKTSQLNIEISPIDEAEMRNIITGVINNNPEYLTQESHSQFQDLLKKYGYSPTGIKKQVPV